MPMRNMENISMLIFKPCSFNYIHIFILSAKQIQQVQADSGYRNRH